MKYIKKHLLLLTVFFLLTISFTQLLPIQKTVELHVFVHGTYGPQYSFLSYPHVKKDKIENTIYLKVQRMMKNLTSEQNRRISGKSVGFVEVDMQLTDLVNEAAYHVIKAYSAIHQSLNPDDKHEHRYFLFAWSGLLSQRERQREAIYLYNELAKLYEEINTQGKKPVIKLCAHSHGCNVALNLALVDACNFDEPFIHDTIENSIITSMNDLLAGGAVKDLPALLGAKKASTMGHCYIKPTIRLPSIDYLMMLCLPVQPETEPLITSPLFKNVGHNYSQNDGVVSFDLVSSKKKSTNIINPEVIKEHPNVKSIRWIVNRTPIDFCQRCENDTKKSLNQLSVKEFNNKIKAYVSWLRRGYHLESHHPEDPTHFDFWGVGNKHSDLFFEQVPLLVLLPFFYKHLTTAGDAQYLDCCLKGLDSTIKMSLFDSTTLGGERCCVTDTISLDPIKKARLGIQHVLNVKKLFKINMTLSLPFIKK